MTIRKENELGRGLKKAPTGRKEEEVYKYKIAHNYYIYPPRGKRLVD